MRELSARQTRVGGDVEARRDAVAADHAPPTNDERGIDRGRLSAPPAVEQERRSPASFGYREACRSQRQRFPRIRAALVNPRPWKVGRLEKRLRQEGTRNRGRAHSARQDSRLRRHPPRIKTTPRRTWSLVAIGPCRDGSGETERAITRTVKPFVEPQNGKCGGSDDPGRLGAEFRCRERLREEDGGGEEKGSHKNEPDRTARVPEFEGGAYRRRRVPRRSTTMLAPTHAPTVSAKRSRPSTSRPGTKDW